jgi:hypothetical protein
MSGIRSLSITDMQDFSNNITLQDRTNSAELIKELVNHTTKCYKSSKSKMKLEQ